MGDTKKFSDVLGEEYDLFRLAVPHHDELQDKIRSVISEYASSLDQDEIVVVDGGCGTGITTSAILAADPRIKVIAIDNEEKTLNQAKKVLEEKKDRITFKQADLLEELKNTDSRSIDVFASAWVIHNFDTEYRLEIFKEIARILKPDGLFVNGDKYADTDEVVHAQELDWQINQFEKYTSMDRPDLRDAWVQHYRDDEKTKFTSTEQEEIFSSIGFVDVKKIFRKGMESLIIAFKA